MKPVLVVHGGAWNIPDPLVVEHLKGVRRAVESVYPLLVDGLSALDAVERAVNLLEEDPAFDAGRGSFLNARGQVELDALIVDGSRLDFGAVGAVQGILHPVSLARCIMERSEHRFLVAQGARDFARQHGFSLLPAEALLTERERAFYQKIRQDPSFTTRLPFEDGPRDTVGAIALDRQGHLAAATSTGGTPRKWPGRIGDSPVIGAGAYADDTLGAASATGWGESILRVLLSKATCDLLVHNSPMVAAQKAIQMLEERVQGLGGVIVINPEGEIGLWHNTPRMAFAWSHQQGQIEVGIHCKEIARGREK